MRFLILGASGMLGRALTSVARSAGFCVIAHGNSVKDHGFVFADLTEPDSIRGLLTQYRPDAVVNLVAMTSVDACEVDIDRAFRLNAEIPEALAVAAGMDVRLIHISTDHVYDSIDLAPRIEAETCLRNVYALTKRAGEFPILARRGVVLRVNFFGQSFDKRRKSFSDTIRTVLSEGDTFVAFHDVYFNPITMVSLSRAIVRVADIWRPGLYNVGASTWLSKFEFARLVAERFGLDATKLKSRGLEEAALRAPRPRRMVMDVTAFERAYDISLPTLEQEISMMET